MFNVNDAKHQRHEIKQQARTMIDAAIDSGKDLTGPALKKYNEFTKQLDDLQARIDRHADGLPQLDDRPNSRPNFNLLHGAVAAGGGTQAPIDMDRFHAELGNYFRGTITASDTPLYVGTGSGVESVGESVPKEVLGHIAAYSNLDSFALAGARQLLTNDTIPLFLPVISAGDPADPFSEGSSATQSKPFKVEGFTFGGTKYSRLVKVSEESLMNSAIPLQSAILDELAASLAATFTAAITTAMLAALTAANTRVLVAEGTNDVYKTLLGVMHAVPPRYALPSNKWMLSRATLAKVKDQRANTSGVPFFDPATNRIFERDVVLNDNLSGGQVVFGDWANGVIVRKSPFFLLPLREAFASAGEVGFKSTQWVDSHSMCELDASNQPLFYSILA